MTVAEGYDISTLQIPVVINKQSSIITHLHPWSW